MITRVFRMLGLDSGKIVALSIWFSGVWFTSLSIGKLAPDSEMIWIIIVSALVQIILSFSQFRVEKYNPVSTISFLLDVLLNAGGIHDYAENFDLTPAYKVLVRAFAFPEQMSDTGNLIFSVIAGIMIAYAPEIIWSSSGGGSGGPIEHTPPPLKRKTR